MRMTSTLYTCKYIHMHDVSTSQLQPRGTVTVARVHRCRGASLLEPRETRESLLKAVACRTRESCLMRASRDDLPSTYPPFPWEGGEGGRCVLTR